MRVNKRAIYRCDECGANECAREIKLGSSHRHSIVRDFQLCDRCAEKLASMLIQRVREARSAARHPEAQRDGEGSRG